MASYPNKPWSDGQTHEVVPGETFIYNASQSVWEHVTKATLDSDYQVDKTVIETNINTNTSAIGSLETRMLTVEGEIDTLQSDVALLSGMSDSETARLQQNISDIETAYQRLDSDSTIIQGLRTDLETEIAATNADVSSIITRLDSDETVVQDIQTQVNALAIPVISASQPTGKTGQLWVNTNDGKLYYWNDSDTFVSIVTT